MSNFVHEKCVAPEPGTVLVVCNGALKCFEPEDMRVFPSHRDAIEYIKDRQQSYPDLDYYVCPITEMHHTTTTRHVRRLSIDKTFTG